MKKLLLFVIVSMLTIGIYAQDNLILNPGFETNSGVGTAAANWNTWNNTVQNTDVYEGSWSGELKVDIGASFLQILELVPGKTYDISFAAKWPNGVGTSEGVDMVLQDSDKNTFGGTSKITSTTWTTATAQVTVPEGITTVRVSIFKPASPVCYIDNVSVVEVVGDDPVPVLTLSDDGELLEDFEDGEVITVDLDQDTFVDPLVPENWTVTNLPEGVSVASVTRISDVQATITLQGNTTGDYDADITNMKLIVGADEFAVYGFPVTVKTGVTFTATVEGSDVLILEEDFSTYPLNTKLDSAFMAQHDLVTQGVPDSIYSVDGYVAMYTNELNGKNNWVHKLIELTPGRTYKYSVDLQSVDGSKTLGVVFEAAADQFKGNDVTGTEWKTSSVQFTVAPDKDTVRLGVYKWGDDKIVNIDNMKLYEVQAPMLELSDDGEIVEGAEDGEVITVKAVFDTFSATSDLANWTSSGLPVGVTIGSLSRVDDTTIEITLSGNATEDYDQTVVSTISASRDEFVTSNKALNAEYFFVPVVEQSITIADDGEIVEGAEDGEKITVTLNLDTFVATLTDASWIVSNLPAGVSVGSVTRVDDTTVEILLAGNTTGDYDLDITNVSVSVLATELTLSVVDLSAETGLTFTAVIELSSITIADDGEIIEGAEDGEAITVTLIDDTFAATLTPANWTVTNLPAGVTVGSVTRTDDVTASIVLSGNASSDYDTDITDVTVSILAAELTLSAADVSATTGVTLKAVVESASITIADDGDITEGAEDGEVITVTLTEDTFVATLNPDNFTVSNLPTGVSAGAPTRVDDVTATIQLIGNATEDYDEDITDFSLIISAADLTLSGVDVSANTGVTFTAVIESNIQDGAFSGLEMYPNPVKDVLHISSRDEIKALKVYNIIGEVVELRPHVGSNSIAIQTSSWKSGIYLIELVDTKGQLMVSKVLK